jgi:ubiquinone/menaquinone biosynthesis C-methylase UbiE
VNCDPIARVYRWLEYASFGRGLQRCREAFLPEIAGAREVLLLGDGDGRFLAAFLHRNPDAHVTSVDSSGRMLALARDRIRPWTGAIGPDRQVRFHQADAATWRPPPGTCFDLIVTQFFLDCFDDGDLERMIPALAGAAAPGARWLVAEFRQPAHGPAAWRAKIWIGSLYAAFRLMTGLEARQLPNYRQLLQAQGFIQEREMIAEWGLLTAQLWRRDANF